MGSGDVTRAFYVQLLGVYNFRHSKQIVTLSTGTHKTSLLKDDNSYILRLIVVILWFWLRQG